MQGKEREANRMSPRHLDWAMELTMVPFALLGKYRRRSRWMRREVMRGQQ